MDMNATRKQAFESIELDDLREEDWGIKIPFVKPKDINLIYNDLKTMTVVLDPDPLGGGPRSLNEKIAISRNYLNRCDHFYLIVSQNLSYWRRILREETAKFDMKKKWMIANDPHVRAGRSATDRDAIAHVILEKQVKLIKKLEISVEDLEMVLGVIRAKKADLKDTQQQIKNQMKLCFEEIRLGCTWGPYLSEEDRGFNPPPGVDSVLVGVNRELQASLQGAFSEMDEDLDLDEILGDGGNSEDQK